MRMTCQIKGLQNTLDKLSADPIRKAVDEVTEDTTYKMVNHATQNAPRLHGRLAGSIASSPTKRAEASWTWGSDMPYATRQEYEHATRRAFIRNAVWTYEPYYFNMIERVLVWRNF